MTAHIHSFPADPTIFARLTERQRQANIAEEREEYRQAALFTLRNHAWHTRQDVEDAWVQLSRTGTDDEREVALAKIDELTAETSRDVLASMRGRLPEALFCAAGLAVVLLAGTGWLP